MNDFTITAGESSGQAVTGLVLPDTLPVPFRLRVLRALTECLESITPANQYFFDLTGKVHRGKLLFGDDTATPFISILEAPIPEDVRPSRGPNPNSTGPWELLIQGFIDDDPNHPSDNPHYLMAEVKKRLVIEKRRIEDTKSNILGMNGKVTEMHIGQGSVRPEEKGSARTYFWLTLTLTLAEKLDDPYN